MCVFNRGREFQKTVMCKGPLFSIPSVILGVRLHHESQPNVCLHGAYILEGRQVLNRPQILSNWN